MRTVIVLNACGRTALLGETCGKRVQVAPRKLRKPSIRKLVEQAEKTGKRVTSVTTPDGMIINFGEPEPSAANNPWLDDLKVTKQ